MANLPLSTLRNRYPYALGRRYPIVFVDDVQVSPDGQRVAVFSSATVDGRLGSSWQILPAVQTLRNRYPEALRTTFRMLAVRRRTRQTMNVSILLGNLTQAWSVHGKFWPLSPTHWLSVCIPRKIPPWNHSSISHQRVGHPSQLPGATATHVGCRTASCPLFRSSTLFEPHNSTQDPPCRRPKVHPCRRDNHCLFRRCIPQNKCTCRDD